MMRKRSERGYSLPELLVVVAIIGLVSLAVVPNFIKMYKNGRMKATVRNFSGRIRKVQQAAVTSHRRSRLSFKLNEHTFTTWVENVDATDGTRTWRKTGTYSLEEQGASQTGMAVWFHTTGFQDKDSDGYADIIFGPNGSLELPDAPNPSRLQLHTDDPVPQQTYTIDIGLTGSLKVY